MESESNPYGKILQETFPGFSRKELANIAHSVKQKLDGETLSERFSYHIEQARQEGGKPGRLRELVMLFIDKCMIKGFEPYSLDLPEAFDNRTLFLARTIYEVYKTHWITPSRTDEAIKLETDAVHDFDKEAWNILKTLGDLERPYFQKRQNIKLNSNRITTPSKEDGSIVITHPDGRAAIHTKDGAWIDLDFRTPEERDPLFYNNSAKENILDSCIKINNSPSIFYELLELFVVFIAHVGYILAMFAFVLPYILLADLFHSWILSILAGTAFWILFAYILVSIPWIKLKPSRNWLFAPIRYIRTLFHRLEKATRPPENS